MDMSECETLSVASADPMPTAQTDNVIIKYPIYFILAIRFLLLLLVFGVHLSLLFIRNTRHASPDTPTLTLPQADWLQAPASLEKQHQPLPSQRMEDTKQKKPTEAIEPLKPLMTYDEIQAALRPCRDHGPSSFNTLARYDPADGIDTKARRTLYRHECHKITRARMWYELHKRTIKKIDITKFPPSLAPVSENDQVRNFREKYRRCRLHNFCTYPWNRDGIDDLFAFQPAGYKKESRPRKGVRKDWTFEKGFQKAFRYELDWVHIDFDEPELAPEEISPNEVAKDWIQSYLSRTPIKPKRVDSYQSAPASRPPSSRTASTIFSSDLNAEPESKRRSLTRKLSAAKKKLGKRFQARRYSDEGQEQPASATSSSSSSSSSSSGDITVHSGALTPDIRRAATVDNDARPQWARKSTSNLPARLHCSPVPNITPTSKTLDDIVPLPDPSVPC